MTPRPGSRRWPRALAAFGLLLALAAAPPAPAEPATGEASPPTVEIFVREGCGHCRRAEDFLRQLQLEAPSFRIVEHDVSADPAALADLKKAAATLDLPQVGLPTFRIGDTVLVGFSGPEGTGAQLRDLLRLPATPPDPGRVTLPLVGKVVAEDFSLPVFTVLLGLLDGFNPCALWVLLFILSLLVHLRSRGRMLLVAGTFVLVSGAVYFAFMAAWLNFFLLLGAARPVQMVLAGVALAAGAVHIKDWFAWGRGPSLSIPDSAKPWIARHTRRVLRAENLPAALAAVVVLALLVNSVELLCTAGLPAVYTQVLSARGLPEWQHYAYLLLYNAAYMLDDAILVFTAVLTLRPQRLGETGGRRLKLLSGVVMVGLGTLLLFRPDWLG